MTGGAGFIGSHYVRTLLAGALAAARGRRRGRRARQADLRRQPGQPRRRSQDDPRLRFVAGRHLRPPTLVDELMAGHDAVVHFAAESHVDRSILGAADFVLTNVLGTQTLLDAALRRTASTGSCTSPPTRSTARSTTGSWDRGRSRSSPTRRTPRPRPSSDLLARAYHRTHGLPVVRHPLLEQLRARTSSRRRSSRCSSPT